MELSTLLSILSTLFWIIVALAAVVVVFFFVVTLALAAMALVFRKKWRAMLEKIVLPDTRNIETQFREFLAKHPGISHEQTVSTIIKEHANKAALIGAALGVGGVFFEMLGAPAADAVTLLRVQANMIFLLAHAHGLTGQLSENDRLKLVLVLSGSNQVAQYVMKMLAKIVFTSIPMIGSVVAYIVNYGVVRATGEAARIQFSGNPVKNEVQGIIQNLLTQARQRASQAAKHSSQLASGAYGKIQEVQGQVRARIQSKEYQSEQPMADATQVMQVIHCRRCNTATAANNQFCNHCGAPLYGTRNPTRPPGGREEFDLFAPLNEQGER